MTIKTRPLLAFACLALSLFSLPAIADRLLGERVVAMATAPDPTLLAYVGIGLILGAAASRFSNRRSTLRPGSDPKLRALAGAASGSGVAVTPKEH